MAAIGGQWGEWWTLPRLSPQKGGRVPVVCDMVSVVTDLSVTELLCQVQANQVCSVQVRDGLGLVHGGGNQNFVTHWVCLTVPISYSTLPPILGRWWTVPQLVGRPNGSIKNSRTVCITLPAIRGSILSLLQSTRHPITYHNSHSCYHKELPS